MGIRYYAYPVEPAMVEAARRDPWCVMSDDPLADAWGLEPIDEHHWAFTDRPKPEMLYLDKCWSILQRFSWPDGGEARPAYQLFQGQVTLVLTDRAWDPHLAVLDVATVAAIADDLDSVTPEELDAFCATLDEDDRDYFLEYFGQARTFARDIATRGLGLAYMIG
ncbi:hypothetical protein [uncultured Tessaracoccus sp.]|uniref:hypothetical protein n=1 Tax=uncultured Tessaracoccus sp. TaxID=905023 RepID=UPI0025D4631C|nr:hypothetical protein [uncultured Tessaracoccus sp.]